MEDKKSTSKPKTKKELISLKRKEKGKEIRRKIKEKIKEKAIKYAIPAAVIAGAAYKTATIPEQERVVVPVVIGYSLMAPFVLAYNLASNTINGVKKIIGFGNKK